MSSHWHWLLYVLYIWLHTFSVTSSNSRVEAIIRRTATDGGQTRENGNRRWSENLFLRVASWLWRFQSCASLALLSSRSLPFSRPSVHTHVYIDIDSSFRFEKWNTQNKHSCFRSTQHIEFQIISWKNRKQMHWILKYQNKKQNNVGCGQEMLHPQWHYCTIFGDISSFSMCFEVDSGNSPVHKTRTGCAEVSEA